MQCEKEFHVEKEVALFTGPSWVKMVNVHLYLDKVSLISLSMYAVTWYRALSCSLNAKPWLKSSDLTTLLELMKAVR
jgi:hypothetical protein